MNQNDVQGLLERVQRLERQNRYFKIAGIVIAVGALMLGIRAKSSHKKEVVAEGFRLVDAHGQTRAELSFWLDGRPRLVLYDKKGNSRAVLSALSEGTGLVLADEKENLRAWLSVLPDGRPMLALYDEKRNTRVMLDVLPD